MTASKASKKVKTPDDWTVLNNALRGCDETNAELLLLAELEGKKRAQFLLRIHSRLNKVRADSERAELRSLAA